MRLGVPKELSQRERRVALVPDIGARLISAGHSIEVERGAGAQAFIDDEAFSNQGARIVQSRAELYASAEAIVKVQPPTKEEIAELHDGAALVSFLQPLAQPDLVEALARQGVSSFSLDLLPRISRAQSMDALSSQATVSGYRAALIAADRLAKFFPMLMTAAGTVPPAKVLVLGAGVAGLQAIATSRRLGAVVRAYDVRPAAREEVRSIGATFVELELESQEGEGGYAREQSEAFLACQRELIGNEVAAADVVITTAAIPGRSAPILVTADMIPPMAPGSVIVDLAAESGGNCELSRPGEDVYVDGVTICGVANLPSSMPLHASFLYARNIAEFVSLLAPEGPFAPNFEDEIVDGTCVTHEGTVRHAATRALLEGTNA